MINIPEIDYFHCYQTIMQREVKVTALQLSHLLLNLHPGQIAAQYLLDDAGVIEYDEVVKLPEPAMSDKSIKFNNEQIVSESINYSDIINVYPNPVNEKIFVEYAFFNFNETSSIEIYGINGNLIYSEDLKQAVGLFTYNNQLPAGNYIIKVGENFTQKITVQ